MNSSVNTKDKLYKRAKTVVEKERNCSISYMQRTLEIGYNRASEIIELLEAQNVITAPDKNNIRKVIE